MAINQTTKYGNIAITEEAVASLSGEAASECYGVVGLVEPSASRAYIRELLKKEDFVFGGTDWEFMIQTATIDGMLEPWLILALFIILLVLIFINIFKLIKKNK